MSKSDVITKVAGAMLLCATSVFCSAATTVKASRVALTIPLEGGVVYEDSRDALRIDLIADDRSYASWLCGDFWKVTPTEIYQAYQIVERDQSDDFDAVAVSYQF